MKNILIVAVLLTCLISCKGSDVVNSEIKNNADLIIAFGSCNKQNLENPLWDDILTNKPSYWIWGGDNIYSDTDDMSLMKTHYNDQLEQKGYKAIRKQTKVHGTWDDHDYGLNDGGLEFDVKAKSQ